MDKSPRPGSGSVYGEKKRPPKLQKKQQSIIGNILGPAFEPSASTPKFEIYPEEAFEEEFPLEYNHYSFFLCYMLL